MHDRETKIRERAHQIWEALGSPDGEHDTHWAQAEREIDQGESAIQGNDEPNLAAMREGARQHSDGYIVAADMEDADQREATPGVREQP